MSKIPIGGRILAKPFGQSRTCHHLGISALLTHPVCIMTTHTRTHATRAVVDSTVLWMFGAAALYFAMQLWILPKMGVQT